MSMSINPSQERQPEIKSQNEIAMSCLSCVPQNKNNSDILTNQCLKDSSVLPKDRFCKQTLEFTNCEAHD